MLARICAAGVALGLSIASGRAANGSPTVTAEEVGYSVAHWTVDGGLPRRVITSLAQTPDGCLWCGTSAALLRFAGDRFRFFSGREIPELKGLKVLGLLCHSAGGIWIGPVDGKIVQYER